MINSQFNNLNYNPTQALYESLILESIKIFGQDVLYLPRTVVNEDHLYGEDRLSRFDGATSIEMYINNVDGFNGEGDFLSKFGLEIRDQLILTVARRRWDQIDTPKLMAEQGFNILLESANDPDLVPSRQFLNQPAETNCLRLEEGGINPLTITSNRPLEGDLIYFPLVDKLFEIKFVEHEEIFYQAGALQTFQLRCELFEYSSERFETGNTALDDFGEMFNLDVHNNELLLEDGGVLLAEDGGSIILEVPVEERDAVANNQLFDTETFDIVDFDEKNPFGE